MNGIEDLKLTVSDLDGSADLSDLVFNVQDVLQQITADLGTGLVFEGKQVMLLYGDASLNITDYTTMFVGVINTVDSDNNNLEYRFTCNPANLKRLTQKIYVTGDDGFATSDKHPRTILGHPLDILVSALRQAGVALADIDTPKIQYYRDTIYNGLLYEFTLTSAPTAKDFIENELMKPLGMYIYPTNLGGLSINSFYPAISGSGSYTPPTPPVITLDVSIDPTLVQQNNVPIAQEAAFIDQVAFKFDENGTGNQDFGATAIVDWDQGILKYGLMDAHTIESQGMRSAFQGYFMAAIISRLIFLRYGDKNLIMDPTSVDWKACVLEPGDIIALNNPFVPDRKLGIMGISLGTFEVMDRTWKFMEGVVELKLLAIDLSKFKQYLITSNGLGYSRSTADTWMFQSNASDVYSDGTPGDTLG